MPIYSLEGPITLKATIVLDAEDEADAWSQIDRRLRASLSLDGHPKYEETNADISKSDLAIGRIG